MVAPIILTRDENGDLRDQEGHLRNEAGQKLNAQNEVIPEPETAPTGAVQPVEEAARTLADYNRPDQFYTNRSAIHQFRAQAAVLHPFGTDTLLWTVQ